MENILIAICFVASLLSTYAKSEPLIRPGINSPVTLPKPLSKLGFIPQATLGSINNPKTIQTFQASSLPRNQISYALNQIQQLYNDQLLRQAGFEMAWELTHSGYVTNLKGITQIMDRFLNSRDAFEQVSFLRELDVAVWYVSLGYYVQFGTQTTNGLKVGGDLVLYDPEDPSLVYTIQVKLNMGKDPKESLDKAARQLRGALGEYPKGKRVIDILISNTENPLFDLSFDELRAVLKDYFMKESQPKAELADLIEVDLIVIHNNTGTHFVPVSKE